MLTPVAGSRRCFGGMVFDDPGRISLVDNVAMNPKPAMIMGVYVYIYIYTHYHYNYNVYILYIQQTHSHHCQYMCINIYHHHMFI